MNFLSKFKVPISMSLIAGFGLVNYRKKEQQKKYHSNMFQTIDGQNYEAGYGFDSDGQIIDNIQNLWKNFNDKNQIWYSLQKQYWNKQPSTDDGMLGGYAVQTAEADINESEMFLKSIFQVDNQNIKLLRAFDVGGGIGRISKDLLQKYFTEIDLLDQSDVQVEKAKINVPFINNFYCSGFQDFNFTKERQYDCIWIQWVLLYLTDQDLVNILKKCSQSLSSSEKSRQGGIIIVKENVYDTQGSAGEFTFDKSDNSVIRSSRHFKKLFKEAGLEIIEERDQKIWPEDLYPIKMYALRPIIY